jgi:ribonuclease G
VGKRDFEQTVFKINMESVNEVVRQIRLRDLGGLIIIDFIDMEKAEHREQVYKALKRALAEDKARTNVLEISELGLVEMTRKRVRQDLRALLSVTCPACKGAGVVKADSTVASEIFRAVQAKTAGAGAGEIVVRVHPELAQYFEGEGREPLGRLSRMVDRTVTIQSVNRPHRDEYDVVVR